MNGPTANVPLPPQPPSSAVPTSPGLPPRPTDLTAPIDEHGDWLELQLINKREWGEVESALLLQSGIEAVDLRYTSSVDSDLAARLHTGTLDRLEAIPIKEIDGVIVVAVPRYSVDASYYETESHVPIKIVVASPKEIRRLRAESRTIGVEALRNRTFNRDALGGGVRETGAEKADLGTETGVQKFVSEMLISAVTLGASDIHIEPKRTTLDLRFRIDGRLEQRKMPSGSHDAAVAVATVIKIMSNLNIAEKRIPQDGAFSLPGVADMDIRVSIIPSLYGESIVMRLLDKSGTKVDLSRVGMSKSIMTDYLNICRFPNGIVLVTGPTGSGKSTTLASTLREVHTRELSSQVFPNTKQQNSQTDPHKILTVENPIEYELPFAMQFQVNEKIELTFARFVRSILRHDPDIILVGEIRDKETAIIAAQAASTGHLVFSTLHTNDAATAFSRLVDLGLEPYQLIDSIRGVVAQRLVRTICDNCKVSDDHSDDRMALLPMDFQEFFAKQPGQMYKGAGCSDCRGSGFKGRTGIHELLLPNDGIREICRAGSVESKAIFDAARRAGMRTLRENGWEKVLEGITTVEEVQRATLM